MNALFTCSSVLLIQSLSSACTNDESFVGQIFSIKSRVV